MIFGAVPLSEAEGAILAHSEQGRTTDGESRRIAKGVVLTAPLIADLARAGMAEVTVARLEPGDIGEDAAATRLAQAILGEGSGLRAGKAATGRVNLLAEGPGVVRIDADAILAANSIDPAITVATVPQWQRMGDGGMAATVKIIAYGVAEAHLREACRVATGAMRLCPPVLRRATLIETNTGAAAPPDKGRRAMAARLARLGVDLTPRRVVAHEEAAIAEALIEAQGELLLILTTSATSDIRDTAPEGVRRAGGRIVHYGMPVDPGNLLFLGALGDRPVIGLPGCARSPALNGADWVLERVICGILVGPGEIAAMGVGGLLKEIPERGRLRQGTPPTTKS